MNEPECLGLCEIDSESGVCIGCGRRCDETADGAGDAASSDTHQVVDGACADDLAMRRSR